jgi:peptidoglycan-associated lipoprotein
VIPVSVPKSNSRRAGTGVALFAALFIAACTCTTGAGFRITKPADGAHFPLGAPVEVCVSSVAGDYCTFPPKAYEVKLDGGQSRMIPADAKPLCTTFTDVAAGPHVADAFVMRYGKSAETSRVKFVVDPPPPPPTPVPTPVPTPMPPPPPPPPPPPAVEQEMVAITQKGGYLEDIFFDYNKFAIKPEYHDRLQRGAEWLKNHPDTLVTIEGHCDIRGTNKYNLVLGKKRSQATYDHMVKLGVDPGRLTVTTVGEERPFDTGKNETAYASNRRAHFIITKH